MIQAKLSLLSNFSFFLLFSSMFLFWIYTSFFFILPDQLTKNSKSLNDSNFVSSAGIKLSKSQLDFVMQESHKDIKDKSIQTNAYKSYIKSKNIFLQLGNLGMFLSNIILFLLLILRWKESGHFPLSNLYESLLFLSWSCTLIHLGLTLINERKVSELRSTSTFHIENKKDSKNLFFSEFTGCITAPCALFTNAFASFCLPEGMQKITPLVPALQSNWLMMHVTVMIFSYSALIVGSLMSIAFLVLTKGKEIKKKKNISNVLDDIKQSQTVSSEVQKNFLDSLQNSTKAKMVLEFPGIIEKKPTQIQLLSSGIQQDFVQQKTFQNQLDSTNLSLTPDNNHSQFMNFAVKLDNLSYRIIGLGFPFLTVGILSGAVWANEAWGSYWSWDPKETWALLTWLIFAIYLHTRISKGWEGKKPALIASLGFLIIWICYLGVNLLGEGLHSYGWLSQN